MTLPVFVVDPDALARELVELSGTEAHHAVTVRRVRLGERVLLTDGAGEGAECVVRSVSKRLLTAQVLVRRLEPPPSPRLIVVQALLKGDAGEAAVDLMTQVGVDVIVPWTAARSVASWRGERGERGETGERGEGGERPERGGDARTRSNRGARGRERWRSTAREAGKQARRLRLPSVEPLHSTAEVAALLNRVAGGDGRQRVDGADVVVPHEVATAAGGAAVVLHQAAETPLSEASVPSEGDLVVVIGPEGGLTDDEVELFVSAGARAVRLGPSVLRASTAGAVAAGILLSRTARWR